MKITLVGKNCALARKRQNCEKICALQDRNFLFVCWLPCNILLYTQLHNFKQQTCWSI